MDYLQIATDVVEHLKALGPVTQELGTGLGAHALWDWLKSRFKARSAAAAEAVSAAETRAATATDWEILKLQLCKALEEDEGLRQGLVALLKQERVGLVGQNASAIGNENMIIQSTGSGDIHVQR
jgi:hypothetical protein